MVTTNRPVKRVTQDSYRVLYSTPRPIVVILEKDTIGFREKGRREVFHLPIETCFKWAVRVKAQAVKKARRG
jgi:hypothetical protein